MKKNLVRGLALAASLTATAFAGAAYAEQAQGAKRGGDTDANGVLTRAEAQAHAAAMFARMDVNKDGKLDRADREARRIARFDRLDTDKNGQLSREEFSARPQRPDGAQAARPEGGKRQGWAGKGHGRGGRHGGMMMGRMADANKDGAITQAEFTAAATQRFDRMDGNKDGQVTKEERQAARAAMRQEWQNRRAASPSAPAQPAN